MDAKQFYDEKQLTLRSLVEGDKVRNTHNFIKSVIIKKFVGKRKKILDLGCGQGGDLLKIKITSPSFYVGVDISHTAILAAQKRFSNIKLNCRSHFLCYDFTSHSWDGYPPYDVVNCQFAIQFAFKNEQSANYTIEKISTSLVEDGFFIGTVPQHTNVSTYDDIEVLLPDDERKCTECVVEINDLVKICEKYELHVILIEKFDAFFEYNKKEECDLAEKMKAFVAPDPNNSVFVFQKRTQNT
tara:strand:- start:1765 stop:2490 length:726 start_codon:yes stop_codon:yes gene_type:complete